MFSTLDAILPRTCDDMLLDGLSVSEMVRFQRVSKDAEEKVLSYIRRNFKLAPVIRPFIAEEWQDEFRALMSETNMLISGSVPLQFFAQATWPTSDLDLYVDELYAVQVCTWLTAHGIEYEPREFDLPWQERAQAEARSFPSDMLALSQPSSLTYGGPEMLLNFKNQATGRRIQLILYCGTPLQAVLNFHSIVMNIITHEKAYCFFPKPTLDEKKGVKQRPEGIGHSPLALEKYRNRGYEIVTRLTRENVFGKHPQFPFGRRTVADTQSWVIPWERSLPLIHSTIDINSWLMTYAGDLSLLVSAVLCQSSRLRFSYVLDTGIREAVLQEEWTKALEANPDKCYLDEELRMVLSAIRK